MSTQHAERKVLITGASSGIGLATARLLTSIKPRSRVGLGVMAEI